MSGFLPSMRNAQILSPRTTAEAIQLLSEVTEPVTIFAGGTDLMAQLEAGHRSMDGLVVDIWRLDELRFIKLDGDWLRIGALTTFREIGESRLLWDQAGILCQAAATVGAIQIQNRATIGGNVMNASPAGDSMPPLLALGAKVVLLSNEGPRVVPLFSFYAGYRRPVAKPSELLTEIRIPVAPPGARDYFRKVGTRRAQAISKVVMAARAWDIESTSQGPRLGSVQIGIGSVSPTPTRLFETERLLQHQVVNRELVARAVQMLGTEITPIDDVRSTAAYRRYVAGNMLEEYLLGLID